MSQPADGPDNLDRVIQAQRAAAEARRQDANARRTAARAVTLASDAEREAAVTLLEDAFADGRLTSAELEERTTLALAARTHGDLDEAVQGLALPEPPEKSPARFIAAGLMTLFTAPFVLVGLLFALAADQTDELVFGLVLLVLFLPGLLLVWRWAWPSRRR